MLILDVVWKEGEVREIESATIVCTKQRSGPGFRLPVNFEPELYRVSDIERERPTSGGPMPELPWGRESCRTTRSGVRRRLFEST